MKRAIRALAAGLCLSLAPLARGQGVDAPTALQAAQNWIEQSEVFRTAAAAGRTFTPGSAVPLTAEPARSNMAYHVALEPQGYIVVGGDRRMPAVLAFSLASDLDLADDGDNAFRSLLFADLAGSWQSLDVLDAEPPKKGEPSPLAERAAENQAEWDDLLKRGPLLLGYTPADVLVEPMTDTRWSQWNHYNELCPSDPAPGSAYGGKVPVGCTAAAGAQVMRYHEWPLYGWGGHSYTDSIPTVTGVFPAVFFDAYDWTNMITNYNAYTSYPSNQEYAVAELMYEVGVACEMDYGSFSNDGGSSAALSDLRDGLLRFFYYETNSYLVRTSSPAAFDDRLRQDLFARLPVPCSVTNRNGTGHAIVADGLSSDAGTNFFHFNYGWGGVNDGWYQPSDINTGVLVKAIFGVQPRFMPLVEPFAGTNLTGVFTSRWAFPKRRAPEVREFRVHEGAWCPSNRTDAGDHFGQWWNVEGRWTNRPSGGNPGACYFKFADWTNGSIISEPFVATTNTGLSFDFKDQLYMNHFFVEITTNRGLGWVVLMHRTDQLEGYTNSWLPASFSLASYAGSEARLRFRFATGSRWVDATFGVYVDNLVLTNAQMIAWSVVATNVASNATSCAFSNHAHGTYAVAVSARDPTLAWREMSPPEWITVDTEGDADADGLPNGWEFQNFSDPTGAAASADSDLDGLNNWGEYRAGTDPWSTSSVFTAATTPQTNGFIVRWPSASNRAYTLWRSTNLLGATPFSVLASNVAATPALNIYTDTTASGLSPYLYRVQVEP